MAIGTNFWDSPIKVCYADYNNVDLGKMTDVSEIKVVEDIKDIFYAQTGTQPADKIVTGQAYTFSANFAEIDPTLISTLQRGVTKKGESLKLDKQMYRSLIGDAKVLTLTAIDETGAKSTDKHQIVNFYKAIPVVTGSYQYGADNQRSISVEFYIFYDEDEGAFGYSGNASSLSLSNA